MDDNLVLNTNIKTPYLERKESNDIIFYVHDNKEMLRLCKNGDIKVKCNLIKNDIEVYYALREFIFDIRVKSELNEYI